MTDFYRQCDHCRGTGRRAVYDPRAQDNIKWTGTCPHCDDGFLPCHYPTAIMSQNQLERLQPGTYVSLYDGRSDADIWGIVPGHWEGVCGPVIGPLHNADIDFSEIVLTFKSQTAADRYGLDEVTRLYNYDNAVTYGAIRYRRFTVFTVEEPKNETLPLPMFEDPFGENWLEESIIPLEEEPIVLSEEDVAKLFRHGTEVSQPTAGKTPPKKEQQPPPSKRPQPPRKPTKQTTTTRKKR